MRRKNRKWVAIAVLLYLYVIWSAYRWGGSQRYPDGPLMVHLQHEGLRRQAAERAKLAESQVQPPPEPTGEARLAAAGPAYVAARYDDSHVVFMVTTETEARFSSSPLVRSGIHTRIAPALHPAAPLAGLQELWEPDSHSLHFFPKIIQTTQPGDHWMLDVSAGLTIPVVIDRVVIAPTGCSLALGFLASVPRDQQKAFAASAEQYFAVRRTPVEPAGSPITSHIGELEHLNIPREAVKEMERQLNDRMKQELTAIDAALVANAGTTGAVAGDSPIGSAHPSLKEWLRIDQELNRGEGNLDYDIRSFTLTPDGAPRLFVRARWTLTGTTVFLMSAWFRIEPPKADMSTKSPNEGMLKTAALETQSDVTQGPVDRMQTVLLFADSSWSKALREGEAAGVTSKGLGFQSILNEFDADHDGWAELLIHSYDTHADPIPSTTLALYLYTDKGLVPLKAPLHRETRSPESCLEQ